MHLSERANGFSRRAGLQAGLIASLLGAWGAVATPAWAQQADSLPFRAGQWGVEFTAADFSGVGALRFTSPRHAWLIDAQGQFVRQNGDTDQLSRFETLVDSDALQLRLGWRRYTAMAPRVVRHVSVGVLGRYASSEQNPSAFQISPPFAFQSTTTRSGGVFAEVGAQWMITPNLGLGAAWSANAQFGETKIERLSAAAGAQPVREKSTVNTLSGSLGGLSIRGTVYF